jgi:hypothetical protein
MDIANPPAVNLWVTARVPLPGSRKRRFASYWGVGDFVDPAGHTKSPS